MSIPLIVLVLVSVGWLFTQFGRRLSASHSLSWWGASLFLIIATISPSFYRPIADVLEIETISNFVLAALTFFIFCNMIELTVSTTKTDRKLRAFVTSTATRDFLEKFCGEKGTSRALVVLPCYNEQTMIAEILARMRKTCDEHPEITFCIVNDGSSDNTETELIKTGDPRFVSHQVNIGVAGVLLTGFNIAKRMGVEYVVQCDSDGQHPIEQIPAMLEEAKRQEADLLIGSRFCSGSKDTTSTTSLRFVGIRAVSAMLRVFCKGIGDPTSGFRVYSMRAVENLISHMPDEYPEPESIALLAVAKMNLREKYIAMKPRESGVSSINGLRSAQYMLKVFSALLGLRMRSFFAARI